MQLRHLIFTVLAGLTMLSASCGDDEPMLSDSCTHDFNQSAMFAALADDVILPELTAFRATTDDLQTATTAFLQNQNDETLTAARTALQTAWLQWQAVAQYSFGPAEDVFLRNSVNNFPLNTEETIAKIENADYDFTSPDAFDKGFPAAEYLLYGVGGSPEAVLDFYATDANAALYADYLNAVINDIKTRTDSTANAWQNGYRDDFVANTGTAAGTALSLIINGLNQNYELIKNEKLGIPVGALTLGFANPESVEALYSRNSTALLTAALQATRDFFTGKEGLGLDDYLRAVSAQKNGQDLATIIIEQLNETIALAEGLNPDLATEIENYQERVEAVYNETARNVVPLKTDMPSVLCVAITYIDNPSDSD